MSLIYEFEDCRLIKHDRQAHSYQKDDGEIVKYQLKEILFENFKRKQKVKKVEVESKVSNFLKRCKGENLFSPTDDVTRDRLKTENIQLMNAFQACANDFGTFHGENNLKHGKVTAMNESSFLIPPNCKFFNKKIEDIGTCIPPDETNKFDFIVMDPPWKNRYIKRVKRSASSKQGYFMMSDDEIVEIPLENYLKMSSIVVIWCTNSETHVNAIKEKFLPKWKLKLLSTWQWMKIDKDGELFCAIDGNKKPFEQIFIATHEQNKNDCKDLEKQLFIFGQPSSIHSHKPPIIGTRKSP